MAPNAKWGSTLANAKSVVLLKHHVDPSFPTRETVTLGHMGLSRDAAFTLRTTLLARTTVAAPAIDFVSWTGTWRCISVDVDRVDNGPWAGSHMVVEVLGANFNDFCAYTGGNRIPGKLSSDRIEQVENGWMYYEWGITRESLSWVNLGQTAAINAGKSLARIYLASEMPATVTGIAADLPFFAEDGSGNQLPYYSNMIVYGDVSPAKTILERASIPRSPWATIYLGKYYTVYAGVYAPFGTVIAGQYTPTAVELTDPKVIEAWYDLQDDGTYTIYRTLQTQAAAGIRRYRTLKYAGLVLTAGVPVEGNATISIDGLTNQTDVVYMYARFRVGTDSQIYRVTADVTASAGAATLAITPTITAETAALGDNAQIYFEAL